MDNDYVGTLASLLDNASEGLWPQLAAQPEAVRAMLEKEPALMREITGGDHRYKRKLIADHESMVRRLKEVAAERQSEARASEDACGRNGRRGGMAAGGRPDSPDSPDSPNNKKEGQTWFEPYIPYQPSKLPKIPTIPLAPLYSLPPVPPPPPPAGNPPDPPTGSRGGISSTNWLGRADAHETLLPSIENTTGESMFGQSQPKSLFTSAGTSIPSISLNLPTSTLQPSQQPQSQQPLGASIFSNSPQPALAGQSTQQPATKQTHARDPAPFNTLLERQKKRQKNGPFTENGHSSQLPPLSMDLGDLARRAQEIGRGKKASSSTKDADSRAHYLLAGSGVAPGNATKDFDKVERTSLGVAPYQPQEPFDPDNEKYLRGLQERGREAMIQEAIDRVHRDFDAHLEETLSINFDMQKKKIMRHFGLISQDDAEEETNNAETEKGGFGRSPGRKSAFGKPAKASTATRSVFGRSGLDKSLIGSPAMGASTATFFKDSVSGSGNLGSPSKNPSGRFSRDKERLFWERVQGLNEHRLQEKAYPVLLEFARAESATLGETPKQLVDAYEAVSKMVGEEPSIRDWSQPGVVRERQFSDQYLDDNRQSQKSVQLRKQILNGARTSLELSMFDEIEATIEKSPKDAKLGGRPSNINKIRAYIRVRAVRKDLAPDGTELQQIGDRGDYCWILIFYLLRCGFVQDAAQYVNKDPAFQSTDRKFISYMTNYSNSPERKLTRKLQDMISAEYHQRLRNAPEHTLDPYRMACYKIIGRCDLSRRNLETIGQGVDDWIWLQFCLARETERTEEISGEIFGLDQIQETVEEIGQKHFQKGQADASGGYGIYFFMQILAGMFESAVAYLHTHNPVSAVHYAIALSYYGLLRVSDFSAAGNELCKLTEVSLIFLKC